jgi:predicted transcriptional regulator of viral defense system
LFHITGTYLKMPVNPNKEAALLDLVRRRGFLRTKEAVVEGFAPVCLSRLVERGKLIRVSRGLYESTEVEMLSEHHTLAEAARAVPGGIVCLLSALVFHGIGTQMPRAVWLAIDRKREKPRVRSPLIEFVWLSTPVLESGWSILSIDNVDVRITNPARTVADCFKFRNRIGLDVALEALRDGLRQRLVHRDELAMEAANCRVWNVIRPYLEAQSS